MNTPVRTTDAPPLLVYAKLVLVTLVWGGTFIAGRIVAQSLPGLQMIPAAGRFAIAAILLAVAAWKLEGGLPRLTRSQLVATFGLGASGVFLYNVSFFAALSRIEAGRAALFVALNPIVVALAMAVFLRERLRFRQWLGILLAFLGAMVIITRGDLRAALQDLSQSFGTGELLMFCAICSWAAYTIVGRHALHGLSPLAATAYAALWGLLLLACGAIWEWQAFSFSLISWQVIIAVAYLGAFGTAVGFVWYYEGVKRIGPARTAVFNNMVPVFGVLLGALILDETILLSMVAGGLLVIAGVTLTNR